MKTSNEGTKYMLGLATNHLAHLQNLLVATETATEFEVSYDFGPGRYVGRKYVHDQKTVTVRKGDKHPSRYGKPGDMEDGVLVDTEENCAPYNRKVIVFETVQANKIRTIKANIESVKGDIEFLGKKIAEWKP